MRRLVALLFVMATPMVLPAVPATAHEHRVEVTVVTEEYAVGITDRGATITEGTYYTLFQGIVVATGVVYGEYHPRGSGVHGTRHFIEDVNGQETWTQVKPLVVGVDDSGEPVLISYEFTEDIVAQSAGTTGHGFGTAVLSLYADGSFVLNTTGYAILEFAD